MEKKFKLFVIAAITLVVLQGAFTIGWMTMRTKTAYINTETVYNNFGLKKKLEAELKTTQNAREHLLDSLRFQLDILSLELQKPERQSDSTLARNFTLLRDYYFQQQQQLQQDNEALAGKYTEQIWSQLNQYIKDYGTENNYEYIFGANGDGALMFANDAVNITEDVNVYVNERFEGQP